MIRPKDRITTSQTAVIVTSFLLATGILTLPRTSVAEVKTPDVWIALLLGGLIALTAGIIIVALSRQFPEKTFYQYCGEIVGKPIGGLLSLFVSFLKKRFINIAGR
ncbi:spore germination protein A2 [Bacillus glycinifermentans]|nr:spore germination protein A2 [Bacillus glycinifermentans]